MQGLIDKYGVVGSVRVGRVDVQIINIPMMSDEHWQELAARQRMRHMEDNREETDI